MFERYTEKARRVIFFARYEASQFGAPAIEPEHLLLGLMREDKTLTGRFFPRAQVSIESIRKEIRRSHVVARQDLDIGRTSTGSRNQARACVCSRRE
jgi:ATP-dependent Clp protease ATP-binding subunit ClpC